MEKLYVYYYDNKIKDNGIAVTDGFIAQVLSDPAVEIIEAGTVHKDAVELWETHMTHWGLSEGTCHAYSLWKMLLEYNDLDKLPERRKASGLE